MSVQRPIVLPNLNTLLQGPRGQKKSSAGKQPTTVGCMEGLRKTLKVEEYQNSLSHLSQIPEGQGQYVITNRPGESRLAGVMSKRLIPLQVI